MKPMLNKILVYLLIGVIYMFNGYGCSAGVEYEIYSSKDSEINITINYISGWSYREDRGSNNSYAQVVFYPPQSKDKGLGAVIAVTVKDISRIGFKPQDIKGMADDLLSKRMKFKDAQVLSSSKIKIQGIEALDIQLSYKTLDKIYALDAKLIPVKERVVILKRENKFYLLRYENRKDEFDKFNKDFSHIIKTLKFKK